MRRPNAAPPAAGECVLTLAYWPGRRHAAEWDLTIYTSDRSPWVETWDARRAWARYLELSARFGPGFHAFGHDYMERNVKDILKEEALSAGWKPPALELDGGTTFTQATLF